MTNRFGPALGAAICLPFLGSERPEMSLPENAATLPISSRELKVPRYLLTHYWWAYVHPNAVKAFERQWLVNLILWGNYNRLCRAVLTEMAESRELPYIAGGLRLR